MEFMEIIFKWIFKTYPKTERIDNGKNEAC